MPLIVSSVAAPFAPHQGTQAELDVELVARTCRDRWRHPTTTERSRSDGDGNSRASSAPAKRTGAPITLWLRLRIAAGTDSSPMKYGPISAGDQRNDEGNRQSEQRRLHGISLSTLRLTCLRGMARPALWLCTPLR